ncbi:MAG: Nif11-like leader peptide family natural product precursor [Desulfobulbaceae bacterium]|jgi:predicted ribosomally synthesized peptide with nif11-like leader|nr:Nif11-like leader peptide family natural product precursor [Desulfobulbaceae bacterium]
MSLNNARRFVEKMREDQSFRNKALQTTGQEDLSSVLQAEGLIFDQRELVVAMAECMAQLEMQTCC